MEAAEKQRRPSQLAKGTSNISRREVLLSSVAPLLAGSQPAARLAMEAYIWQQYAARQGKSLGDVLDDVFPMARSAGFTNVELNDVFFEPALRARVVVLVGSNKLRLPSVYVGGTMHEVGSAEQTVAHALEIARICSPFGCRAVVHNPSPKKGAVPKTDAELDIQGRGLDHLGQALSREGFELRVHHHSPEMANNAREWRYILNHTDPKYVSLCLDLDWIHQGDQDPISLLKEANSRVKEIHVRNSRDKLWLESVDDGDIDYSAVAAYLRDAQINPLIVVELAYKKETLVTRSLAEDLRLSRLYTERVFGLGK